MITKLLLAVATLTALSFTAPDFDEYTKSDTTEPTVLALEIGCLGDDSVRDDARRRRLGDTERVFGPVHPKSRLGSYTGNGLGSYTGRGLGSYTGSGLGGTTTFGTGSATGGQTAEDRLR